MEFLFVIPGSFDSFCEGGHCNAVIIGGEICLFHFIGMLAAPTAHRRQVQSTRGVFFYPQLLRHPQGCKKQHGQRHIPGISFSRTKELDILA